MLNQHTHYGAYLYLLVPAVHYYARIRTAARRERASGLP